MNDCKYCGATNPAAVFNCLKCNALMPVQPAPVQNIKVAQERRLVVRNAPVNPIPQPPTATQSFTSFCIYFGVALGVVGLFVAMFFVLNKIEPFSTPVSTPTAVSDPVSGETGFYLDYKFTLMKKASENKAIALFQPNMLPRNDQILIGATRQVINQAFGKEVSGNPVIVGNEIKFSGKGGTFYVLPIKEDTGEIHTLVIRH